MATVYATFGVLLAFIAYIPYLQDTFSGKTKPHFFSWFLWSVVSFIAGGIQISDGAGVGALTNLAMGFICLVIATRSLLNGTKDITRFDIFSAIMALVALILWLLIKQPLWSMILIVITDFLSFIPTIRKSWYKPEQETLATWVISCTRQILTILAMQNFTVITVLYPAYSLLVNSLFVSMLIMRRSQLKK